MARGWNACVLLLLAASALTVSADFYTDDQIDGMIASNCLYKSPETVPAGGPTTPSNGLTHVECAACVNGFNTPTSTVADSDKIEACFNLCQDPLGQLPGLPGVSPATKCTDCLKAQYATRESCRSCLALPQSADATACLQYWIDVPGISNKTATKEPAFIWAVAECHKFPTTDGVREDCLTCLEAYEWDDEIQTQYFGKCLEDLKQAAYIATNQWDKVSGIYAMCGAPAYVDGDGLSPQECVTCMQQVEEAFAGVVQDPKTGPQLLRKPYGCAEYCQQESLPFVPAENSDYDSRCVECLVSFTPADAWACGNCATQVPQANKAGCFDCIMDDPYAGQASNFNWACAECSKITNTQMRALCLQCIRSQGPYDPKSTEANMCSCVDLVWHANSADIHPGVITISMNRTLDAFERKCFMPQYNYTDPDTLVAPPIPWGADILPYRGLDGVIYVSDADGESVPCPTCVVNSTITAVPTSDCIECVKATRYTSTEDFPKQYACSEYCQDPATILPPYVASIPSPFGSDNELVDEGQECSYCVTDPRIIDPSDCKACIAATNDFEGDDRAYRRRRCLITIRSTRNLQLSLNEPVQKRSLLSSSSDPLPQQPLPVQTFTNSAWGASQCAQMINLVAMEYCFKCILASCEDPCVCVFDASQTDTSDYSKCGSAPVGGGCTGKPATLWFWTWVPRECTTGCTDVANWKPRSVISYDFKFLWRSAPDTAGNAITGCPTGTPAQNCGWQQVYPATPLAATAGPYEPKTTTLSGPLRDVFTVAGPLLDQNTAEYYDVQAIKIDILAIADILKTFCDNTNCQWFLAITNAKAQGEGTAVGEVNWDNNQAEMTINGDGTGYQNNGAGSGFNPKNHLAIEVDTCDNNMMYTSLSPYPTTAMGDDVWMGGPGTYEVLGATTKEVWRMFQFGAITPHPPNGDAHPTPAPTGR